MSMEMHITNNSIEGRVPNSYRGCAGSDTWCDDTTTFPAGTPAGAKALEEVRLDGMLLGDSSVRLADVIDGSSNTILIGESYTDTFSKNGQQMDCWQIESPQTGGWTAGGINGTEFTEGLGSTAIKINARLNLSQHGIFMEMSFGSYHVGGAHFALADGSVRFISENIDITTYRGLGSRKGGEILGEF